MSDKLKMFAEASAEYKLAKTCAEDLAKNVATLSAAIWVEELDKRFPEVSFGDWDQIIEVGFGTDPSAVVGLVETLKQKGLTLEHVDKDPYGLRLCCKKIPEGETPTPSRATFIGA